MSYSWLPEVSSTNLAFAMCPSFSRLCPGLSFKLQPGLCLLPFALALVVAPTWPLPFALRSLACSQSQVSSSNLAFACCPLLLRWWPVESCRPWRSSDQVSSTNPAFAICPGSSKLIFTRCDLSIGLHQTAHLLFRLAARSFKHQPVLCHLPFFLLLVARAKIEAPTWLLPAALCSCACKPGLCHWPSALSLIRGIQSYEGRK